MTPAEVALLARELGATDEEAVFLASVVPGESGGDPKIVNERSTCGTENGRPLHAVGLVQVCEYSSRGTREQLQDPRHNLAEGLKILRNQGKAAFTALPDADAASEARAALAGGGTMQTWHPRAFEAPAGTTGSSYIGVPYKLVIHTIEAPTDTLYSYNPSSYYGSTSWPHATIDSNGIHQHYPISSSARALEHPSGMVDTNNANAIQCEVMGQAEHVLDLPDSTMAHLADWLSWCVEQAGMQPKWAEFVAYPNPALSGEQRFGDDEWLGGQWVCGHQHVPHNSHGDPGAIDTDKLKALMGQEQEDDMTPEEHDSLNYTKGLVQDISKAVARMEDDLRNTTTGLKADMDKVLALLQPKKA